MQEYYFYKTTCTINGKFYYGSGSTSKSYLGSGKILNQAIQKYGRENFVMEKLRFFKSREDAFEFEGRFLRLYKISENTNSYNLKDSGIGGFPSHTHQYWKGKKRKAETKVKIREALIGNKLSEEHKENISKSLKGKSSHKWSKESRLKASLAKKGKTPPNKGKVGEFKWFHNPDTNEKKFLRISEQIPEGFIIGRGN